MEYGEVENGIKIGDAGLKGLGLFATRPLSPQDIIHEIDQPALVAISTSKLPNFCYNCYAGSRPADEHGYSIGQRQDAHLKVCTGCQMAHFCGKPCQTEAWRAFHKYECKKFAKWRSRLGSPFSESNRAIIRLIFLHYNGLLPDGLWEKVLSLESHSDQLESSRNGVEGKMIKISAEAIKAYTGTEIDVATVLKLTLILRTNAMVLTTTCGDPFGVFLDPVVSRMNHSCDGGNVVIHRPVYTNHIGWTSQSTSNRSMMRLFPVRELAEGEELTITYIDREQGVYGRQESLEDKYPFSCGCNRCRRDLQALEDIKQKDPGLSEDLQEWSETVDKQKSKLASPDLSPQTVRSAIASLENVVRSMKSKRGFTLDWSPYPKAVHELRLAYLNGSAAYDKALVCALEEYFVIRPVLYPSPLDPWRTIQAIFLVELLGMFADTYFSPDVEPERIKQREAIEKKGLSQASFVYWYFRICKDVRGPLLQSAAIDLAEVLLKLQMSVGMPLDEAEKLLRDVQIKSKAEEEMRGLLEITREKWLTITKR